MSKLSWKARGRQESGTKGWKKQRNEEKTTKKKKTCRKVKVQSPSMGWSRAAAGCYITKRFLLTSHLTMIELTLSALFLCGVTLPNLPDYFLPGCGRSWTRIQLSFQHILLCWCYQQSYLLTVNQDEGPPPLMNAKNTWKPPVTAAVCLSDGEKIATMNTVSIRWSCYSELCLNPNMSAESKT